MLLAFGGRDVPERLWGDGCPRTCRSASWTAAALLASALLALALAAPGCGGKEKIHPALRVEGEELDRAIRRGKGLVSRGADPYEAFTRGTVDVSERISADVILWSAGICWPSEQVAFQIAEAGDASDAGIRRAVREAVKLVERELRCTATVQLPTSRDPADIQFRLRSNTGVEYPPLAVETPIFIRETASILNPNAPSSAIYYYVVRFPIRGGPGVPAIGPQVNSLFLVLNDGLGEATAEFRLPRPRPD
jgi:hypothetical protein